MNKLTKISKRVICKIIGHKEQAYAKDGKLWKGCTRCTPENFIKKSVGDIMNDQINEIIDSMHDILICIRGSDA